uniref:Uncharacterized protein n=1 Tax=Rhipicephalus appendiculatus TaxID=34631 RepID=A0A131YEB4_RHIAP
MAQILVWSFSPSINVLLLMQCRIAKQLYGSNNAGTFLVTHQVYVEDIKLRRLFIFYLSAGLKHSLATYSLTCNRLTTLSSERTCAGQKCLRPIVRHVAGDRGYSHCHLLL